MASIFSTTSTHPSSTRTKSSPGILTGATRVSGQPQTRKRRAGRPSRINKQTRRRSRGSWARSAAPTTSLRRSRPSSRRFTRRRKRPTDTPMLQALRPPVSSSITTANLPTVTTEPIRPGDSSATPSTSFGYTFSELKTRRSPGIPRRTSGRAIRRCSTSPDQTKRPGPSSIGSVTRRPSRTSRTTPTRMPGEPRWNEKEPGAIS